jgi:tetratricopeptide (TPR) repeat protein
MNISISSLAFRAFVVKRTALKFVLSGSGWSILLTALILSAHAQSSSDTLRHDKVLQVARDSVTFGRFKEAIDLLTLHLEGWPDDIAAKDLLAKAKHGLSTKPDYDKAIAASKRALQAQDYDRSIASAKKALMLQPDNPSAKLSLAEAESGKSSEVDHVKCREAARDAIASADYDGAIDLLTVGLQSWPNDASAKKLLAQAEKGKANQKIPVVSAATAAEKSKPELLATNVKPTGHVESPQATPGESKAVQATNTPPPVTSAPGELPASLAGGPHKTLKGPPKNTVQASGDFFLGNGTISLPFAFSLKGLGLPGVNPVVNKTDRKSTYEGATLSYSYGQRWFFDMSYQTGNSSGQPTFGASGSDSTIKSTFTLDDTWYQFYVRYVPKRLSLPGKKYFGYFRVGGSYVTADMRAGNISQPPFGVYDQKDTTTDLLGNVGFGIGRKIVDGRRFKFSLQLEGEGFFGMRSQNSLETLKSLNDYNHGHLTFQSAKIDNSLFGGLGRATMHFEYKLGNGLYKLFGDVGGQGRMTEVTYPGGAGTANEILWGPYGKLGLSYTF